MDKKEEKKEVIVAENKQIVEETKARRKEALLKLPQFRGVVPTRKLAVNLPLLKKGQLVWVEEDDKLYSIDKKGSNIELIPIDEGATISLGITVLDLNKQIVNSEGKFDFCSTDQLNCLRSMFGKFFNTHKDHRLFLLYSRELHHFTLFEKTSSDINAIEAIVDFLKKDLSEIGTFVSADIDIKSEDPENDLKSVVEIWFKNGKEGILFYLIPFDGLKVRI